MTPRFNPADAVIVPDPVTLGATSQRGAQIFLGAQHRWFEHVGEASQAMGIFAMKAALQNLAALHRFATAPGPQTGTALANQMLFGTAREAADEFSRCSHIMCACWADLAHTARAELNLAVASTHTPDVD
ncbi:MAG: hypothetical protein ACFBRM_13250 [Pikeienuella sp.]